MHEPTPNSATHPAMLRVRRLTRRPRPAPLRIPIDVKLTQITLLLAALLGLLLVL